MLGNVNEIVELWYSGGKIVMLLVIIWKEVVFPYRQKMGVVSSN